MDSETKFVDPNLTYAIGSEPVTFSWTDDDVSGENDLKPYCGPITWEIIALGMSIADIETSVYTVGDLSAETKTITIETDDVSRAGDRNS